MDSHQYHLQSLIYTLALHRFLGTRVAEYRYDDQVGGVYYLFLRAMHPHAIHRERASMLPDRTGG
jgi:exodeoxyribonuclease V beta subunit